MLRGANQYILKIAALIELGKSTVSKNICLDSIQIASSMVLDYFLPTLCDVYNLLTVDPKNNKIDKITEALKSSKELQIILIYFEKSD